MRKSTFTMLFLSLIFSFTAQSQVQDDTIRTVIITEFHEGIQHAYLELTNVGDEPVNLKDFEVGHITWKWAYVPENNSFLMLPDYVLEPDSTFLLAQVFDYAANIGEPVTWKEIWKEADLQVHFDEGKKNSDDDGLDSISYPYQNLFWTAGGNSVYYLRHHVGDDSVVVDGVRHHFRDGSSGANEPADPEPKVVAGVENATGNSVLIRKTSIQQGNTNWSESRGTGPEDSEWIVVPMRDRTSGYGNPYFTTLGHHGEAQIEGSLESDVITIDFNNKKMLVPWGIYGDSIMQEIRVTSKGIAWHYTSSPYYEDSTHHIVVTNDTLSFYAVGAEVEQIDFALEQGDAPADMALVFPLRRKIIFEDGDFSWQTPFYVTENQPVIDTIGGLPFATRVDTLMKYIEKAPNASWEIMWVDDAERADLKNGDKLKVTAEDGTTVKEYFLAVDTVPDISHDARLSAITWPDLPDALRRNLAWKGDTIPSFSSNKASYRIELPYGTNQVPALVGIPRDLNAKISTERATRVHGSQKDRTTTITVTAEDDTTNFIYKVEFYVEKPASKIQPLQTEPIISQIGYGANENKFFEITNPGTKPLDLSNYMICVSRFVEDASNPAELVVFGTKGNDYHWKRRYMNYIPGYLFKNETPEEWAQDSGIVVTDLRVNPILGPGESFLIGRVKNYGGAPVSITSRMSLIWTNPPNAELFEANRAEWEIEDATIITEMFWAGIPSWAPHTSNLGLFKIKNDSIHEGTKAVGDPNDFELIDFFGSFAGFWSPGADTLTKGNPVHNIRKPEIWEPNPGIGTEGSWADTDEESEWNYFYRDQLDLLGYTTNEINQMLHSGWGYHEMNPITLYKSTVSSLVYNVSDGFETPQSIDGVVTGTTVEVFMTNIQKEDDGQSLELIGRSDDAALVNGDTLKVTSADGKNVTKYVLSVTDEGLSSDAVLKAASGSGYTIEIDGETASISGILIGSTIDEVLSNVVKPSSATLNILDKEGNLVPLQTRGFDGDYKKTLASNDIYLEVIAGDHVTVITYQLQPEVENNEAYAYSNVYDVDQETNYITDIPLGISVEKLFNHLFTNEGASMIVNDKNGLQRETGDVKFDDVVVVTSPDETVEKVYRLQFIEEEKGNDAYVVSDVYTVDDFTMNISNVDAGTSIIIFASLLEPALGASMVVLDVDGNEKTSGEITSDDKVRVTSASGEITVEYTIDIAVNVNQLPVSEISVYPNPVSDVLQVNGLENNSLIVIRNIYGATVKMVDSEEIRHNSIPVNELSSGMYFITVMKDNNRSNTIKFIKK